MEIYDLLDKLEQLLEASPHIPLTGKVIVEEDDILDFLDRLRTVLPQEVKETATILQEKDRLIKEAHEEAQRIMRECKSQVDRVANEAEVVRLAQAKAQEIYQQATEEAQRIQKGAKKYAAEVLVKLEQNMENTLRTVRQGKSVLEDNNKQEDENVG